jgi:CP family cyanate transporter-like MFS transporter
MTGVYTMALCLGAALAAGASVPLAELFGGSWQPALAAWALPAVLAALVWLPQTRQAQHAHRQAFQVRGLWRDPLAWQVTLYMGLQSSLAYIVFGWLPSILIDRGLSPTAAGLMMSGSVMVQLLSALGAPWLGTRGRDQRLVVFLVLALTLAGLLGLLYAPGGSLWLWAVVLGLGQGGTFSIGLALIVLRSPDAHVASHLSGMAQGVGYTLAALGPFLVGLVHDLSDGWNAVGVIFIAISLGALVAGLGAGRDRLVGVRSEALP